MAPSSLLTTSTRQNTHMAKTTSPKPSSKRITT
jgi:hypothetical protein